MVLEVPAEAYADATPGQFVQVEVAEGAFPLTRRPLTIDGLDRPDRLRLLFEAIGSGTSLLASRGGGESVRVLGPLGTGYDLHPGRWVLVGGGMGAAGLAFLASRVGRPRVLLGASTASRLVPLPGLDVLTATEDGSAGIRGPVTALLDRVDWTAVDRVAVCGPSAMIRAVVKGLPPDLRERTAVSTEARMGCGWGVCEGCTIPAAGGGTLKCCTDGPVLPADRIDWDRWTGVGR